MVQIQRSKKKAAPLSFLPKGYVSWLSEIKERIHRSQQAATQHVNRELILLYWSIGKSILEQQSKLGWGAGVIDKLAVDLYAAFPGTKGFSPRNSKYMRAFAEAWPENQFVQEVLAQLPWYHHLALLEKLETTKERKWYIAKALEHNWSRNTLVIQIETGLINRSGRAVTNFEKRLPKHQSDLARESLKDPYKLDFLGLGEEAAEREIEQALVSHVTRFLIELGAGFAYVGRQVHIEVGGDDFYLDLLFYHLKLRCYVVIEIKAGKFKPGDLGQLGFYMTAIDNEIKQKTDKPTIGLILCKSKNKIVAEYALQNQKKPIGIAEYQMAKSLPKELKTSLPSIEQIECELGKQNTEV